MQETKEKKPQDDSIRLNQIVKVFLFIIGFSIIMRSDLWVSLCMLMVVGGYLIRAFLLKIAKNGFDIAKAKAFVRKWYEQNVVNKKDGKDDVKKVPAKEPPLQFPVIEFEPRPVPAVVANPAPVFDWRKRQVAPVHAAEPSHHPDTLWDMDTALSICYGEPEESHRIRQDIDDDYLLRLGVVDAGLIHQENPS